MEYNLFSLHDFQERHVITLDFEGVHMFDRRLTIQRNKLNSSMFPTRLPPSLVIPDVSTTADVPSDQFSQPGHALPGFPTTESGIIPISRSSFPVGDSGELLFAGDGSSTIPNVRDIGGFSDDTGVFWENNATESTRSTKRVVMDGSSDE